MSHTRQQINTLLSEIIVTAAQGQMLHVPMPEVIDALMLLIKEVNEKYRSISQQT